MDNIKIISFSNRPYVYHHYSDGHQGIMILSEYRIKLADKIADYIRRHTNIRRKDLINPNGDRYYLDDENIVKHSYLSELDGSDRIDQLFIEALERIGNQGDEDFFINHILTDEGKERVPSSMHKLMREEYGLLESRLEWRVAHFFIHLTGILYDPGYDGPKRYRKARIIICGGRHFSDYSLLETTMNEVLSNIEPWRDVIEIVSGHCEGADQLGELYALNHGMPCKVFPAHWDKYGKTAGPIRNSEMVQYASEAEMPVVVAFRSPGTKGTNDTIKKARQKGFRVYVVDY